MKNKNFTLVELMIITAILGVFLKGILSLPVKTIIKCEKNYNSHIKNMNIMFLLEKIKQDVSNSNTKPLIKNNIIKLTENKNNIIYKFNNNNVIRIIKNNKKKYDLTTEKIKLSLLSNNLKINMNFLKNKQACFIIPFNGGYYVKK